MERSENFNEDEAGETLIPSTEPRNDFEGIRVTQAQETAESANVVSCAETELLCMPLAMSEEVAHAGFPELGKAILAGALSVGMLSAPESALAEEAISIPKEHALRFEQDTGMKLSEIAARYGMRIDHSMTSPGATQWVIHVGQMHGQMDEGAIHSPIAVAKSQTKVYNLLNEMASQHGVDTVYEEGFTDADGDARSLIQEACEATRTGAKPDTARVGELFTINKFFDTTVRNYVRAPLANDDAREHAEILTKLGGATMLGCEGKLRVLPAEDLETNQSITSLDVVGDTGEVMEPYKKALTEAIATGRIKAGLFGLSDANAIRDYEKAIVEFLSYNFSDENLDTDPMTTLLAKLTNPNVRKVFEDFNEQHEVTKNKTLKFDREIVALTRVGALAETNPDIKAIPLVYGAIHNFVSSLPAYNKENPIKLNYIRMSTSPHRNILRTLTEEKPEVKRD